jgi:iron complex outermembrane recepter protein
MRHDSRLSCAIAAILGVQSTGVCAADSTATDQSSAPGGAIAEIVVTATRRTENLQDVPIAITAITGETLAQLNVQTFDDLVKYIPNVSTASKGPGINEIYMRGLSTTQGGAQGGGGINSFPNVAVYLDDQSAQLPSRNLDVYAADLERIEVLEGPQGTLYGAGAQAGAIRYITNKPKIDATEGAVTASYSTTAHGDPSSSVEAHINIPLIPDTLAVRAVIYDDTRGGYIHNVPGTFARSGTDIGVAYYFKGVVPPNSATVSNNDLVNHAYNPTTYKGARLSGLYKFNDDWNLLLQQSYQTLEADGSFAYAPSLGDLNVQEYNPSSNKDQFENTAWTLNGRIGLLKAVYTGGFLDHNVSETQDYTAYSRGAFGAYYQCNGPSLPRGTGTQNVCYSPSAFWQDNENNTHQTHELRLSTPDDWRARGIFGLFWEDYRIKDNTGWFYADPQAGFFGQAPPAASTSIDPGVRPNGDVFFDDITRGYKQKAAFGEFSVDIVPRQLTLSVGTRLYSIDTYELGSSNSGYGCRFVPAGQCDNGNNLNADHLDKTYSGHKDKFNLSWKIAEGVMVYATYSEGFRPGGFNRGQGALSPSSPLYGTGFQIPLYYGSDTLKNKEIGWKTSWLDHHLQFDGAIYQEDWLNVQLSIFDPSVYGNQIFTANGPDYRVRGMEGNVVFNATDHLSVLSSFAWDSSSQQNAPSVVGNNGQSVELFPTQGLGSTLAQCPPFQGNIRVRYEFAFRDYAGYWQVGAQHTAHSYSSVITQGQFESPRQNQDPYTTYDASLGTTKGPWNVEFFGQNLSDTRAQLYVNDGFTSVHLVTPNRPRTLGVRMGFRF